MKKSAKDKKTTGQIEQKHSVGILFDHARLNDMAYGEKAYNALLACLDFRYIGDCNIVSGDAGIASDIYVIAFQNLDCKSINYIIRRITAAYYIYGGGIPLEPKRKTICRKEFYLKDDDELNSLNALGSVIYQLFSTAMDGDCDSLPLLMNGTIANGEMKPRNNSLFWLVLKSDSTLRKRLIAEAREGFQRRQASAESTGNHFKTAINVSPQNKKEGVQP